MYFIQRGSGPIKIGYSMNPLARMDTLQTGSAERLQLLGVLPGGRAIEKSLQHAWQYVHQGGEWYGAHPMLLRYIRVCTLHPSIVSNVPGRFRFGASEGIAGMV